METSLGLAAGFTDNLQFVIFILGQLHIPA